MSASTGAIKSVSRVDLVLAFMAVVSIAIIAIPQDWLQTSFEIVPNRYPAHILGDVYVGGASEAHWLDKDSQRWACELKAGAQDPFCSIQIDVTDDRGIGVDLSEFDELTIWAKYQGSATHLRLYLRNRHPNYYVPGIDLSTKYNAIEVPVREIATGLKLRMKDFTVAGWWIIGGNIPLSDSQPEFNEVAIIEVQTGSTVRSGKHEIQLEKMRWSGPIVKQSTLYQFVIIAWSVAIFYILSYRLFIARIELKRQRTTQEELMALNASLSLETRRFEELAKTDALTGLLNRVGVRDILYKGLLDWRNNNTPFSFIIIDLDNFKRINDTYGHDIGDTVLRDAAQLMLNMVRRTDALTRWGGEEFVLACLDCNLEQAKQVAENLRSALESKLICHGSSVTASFGVATMKEPKLEKLFKNADAALYRAKQLGRNRVCTELFEENTRD